MNKGEFAEHALAREVREEIGLNVVSCCFNRSEYYEKSNTLMLNFACLANSDNLSGVTAEVDYAAWYTPQEAREAIYHDCLAERFLLCWLDKRERYDTTYETYRFLSSL